MNLRDVGGVPFYRGPEECWNFGWIEPEFQLMNEMPDFKIDGQYETPNKIVLWDAAKSVYGRHLECFHQSVGSCVGMGKAKCEWYLMCCEIIRGQPWRKIMPYEPYGYAQSRVAAGIRGNSDGSTGAGGARAARIYGVLRSDFPDLPPWQKRGNTIYWPGNVDREWGRAGAPTIQIERGKQHLVRTTASVRSADQVKQAIINKFPCTIASNWGGHMRPPLAGNPPVRLNTRTGTWMHQMMVCGWWNHPTLGEIFYIQNSWGEGAHGAPASDEPPGGFWINKANMDFIVRQGDSYAFSQFNGFPGNQIPWVF